MGMADIATVLWGHVLKYDPSAPHWPDRDRVVLSNGHASMLEFAHWSAAQDATTIIVGGHSLWFKEFFKCFIPSEQEHVAQRKKIVNCGVVAVDLVKADGDNSIRMARPRMLFGTNFASFSPTI
mgnify:CR=1 FL=1